MKKLMVATTVAREKEKMFFFSSGWHVSKTQIYLPCNGLYVIERYRNLLASRFLAAMFIFGKDRKRYLLLIKIICLYFY